MPVTKMNKLVIGMFIMLVIFVVPLAAIADSKESHKSKHASSKLIWSEDALDVEVLNGTVIVKNVSFAPYKDINKLSFKIGDDCEDDDVCSSRPELRSLVEVVQVTPGPAQTGMEVQLALTFSIPSDTPEGEYPGHCMFVMASGLSLYHFLFSFLLPTQQ